MQVLLAQDKMWPGGGLLNHIIQTLGTPANLRKAQAAIDASDPGIRAILDLAKAQVKEDKLADVASNLGNHPPGDKPTRGR
ncbi:MAG: hypothetical protein MRY32_04465 [Rickettsiales bacterium]|nr:hypothetical protein [Rickettsiales bacterium]